MDTQTILKYVMNSPENTNPNVLKGMLDELSESSDGGGSSDFSTAEVTVVYPSGVTNATVQGAFCISMSGIDASIPSVVASGTYDMILYKGSGVVMFTLGTGRSVTVTGNAEDMGDESYLVTGDCTITIS